MMQGILFSVFTKPWKSQPIEPLAERLHRIGFDGIEFPLRDGYQVEPGNAVKGLPELAGRLAGYGIRIASVASSLSEGVFEGCALAGIPVIRIMANFPVDTGYYESEARAKAAVEAALPLCERYGVKIGVQHHYGTGVTNSMELMRFIEEFDPKCVGAIWDSAHSALAGEEPRQGLQIVWPRLCMVNLKNAFYRKAETLECGETRWDRCFVLGSQGMSSWRGVADCLKSGGYSGAVCLTAEYSEEHRVDEFIAKDIAFAKSLFN